MSSETADTERRLVQRCIAGDNAAWNEFFETYNRTIYHVARSRKWGFQPDEAEDAAQDIAEEIVKSLETFEFKSSVRTFVFRIAANTCIARLRKQRALKRSADADPVALDTVGGAEFEEAVQASDEKHLSPEEALGDAQRASVVRDRLRSLSETCRRIIRLRYWNELSFAEIAAIMKAKENTVIVQMKRCLMRLAKSVNREGRDGCLQEP